jgi:hypothetical protein
LPMTVACLIEVPKSHDTQLLEGKTHVVEAFNVPRGYLHVFFHVLPTAIPAAKAGSRRAIMRPSPR